MGQILFWLEAAVATVLFVTLGMAVVCRIQRPTWRWILQIAWIFVAAIPWVVFVAGFLFVEIRFGGALFPLISSATAGIAVLVVSVLVIRRGRRLCVLAEGTTAASWRLDRLVPALAAALLLTGMTFWNLDLAVRQEMAMLQVEAGAIVMSCSPPRVPESQNAAVLYSQAVHRLDDEGHVAGKKDWINAATAWLTPEKGPFNPDDKRMLAFLEKHKAVLESLRAAAERPACNFELDYNPPSMELDFRHLGRVRFLGKLLCISSRVACRQGRMTDAMRDLNAVLRMADHVSVEPALITGLLSISIEESAFETFQYILEQGRLTDDSLDVLHINPSLNFNATVHRGIRMETAFVMSIFMLNSTVPVSLEDTSEFRFYVMSDIASVYRVFLWREDISAFRQWRRREERLTDQPYFRSLPEWKKIEQEMQSDRNRVAGLFTSFLLPSLWRYADLTARADAEHRLMELSAAMWRYRLDHGAFPDDLNLLAPKYFPAVPLDPFTGRPLKMTRRDGRCVIYSLAGDLRDDGGGRAWNKKTRSGDVRLILGK